jgi:hypothetical protein
MKKGCQDNRADGDNRLDPPISFMAEEVCQSCKSIDKHVSRFLLHVNRLNKMNVLISPGF